MPVPFLSSNAQIVVDEPRKTVYVVYPAGTADGRWNIMLAVSRDGGATWRRVQVNDDAPCANHMIPSAALDPRTGRVHVIWLENRTGRGGVAYASCDPGGARCKANEAVSDEPFASYGFVDIRRDGSGSTAPCSSMRSENSCMLCGRKPWRRKKARWAESCMRVLPCRKDGRQCRCIGLRPDRSSPDFRRRRNAAVAPPTRTGGNVPAGVGPGGRTHHTSATATAHRRAYKA